MQKWNEVKSEWMSRMSDECPTFCSGASCGSRCGEPKPTSPTLQTGAKFNEFGIVWNAKCVASIWTYFNIDSAVKRKCETCSCIWPGSIRDAAAAVSFDRTISDSNRVTWTGGRWRTFERAQVIQSIQCFSCFKAFRLVNADIQERPARPSTRQNFKPGDWTCQVLNVEALKAEGTNLKFRVWKVWYLF